MTKVWEKLNQFYKNYFVLCAVVRQMVVILVAFLVMLYNVYLGNMVLLFLTLAVNDTKYMYGWKQFLFLCLIFFFLAINSIFAFYSL